jgi:5'-methylthioadenosine phosphorylase
MLAIIGGSGLTRLPNLDVSRRESVRTPFGEPSGPLSFGAIRGVPIAFMARHGEGHNIPPHQINYRANLWALKEKGAREIVSVAAVGGIRADLGPGTIVVPHQIIDYTWGRMNTYFEGDAPVRHIDFTEPYCGRLRSRLLAAAKECGEPAVDGAVYAATQGPRLETAAEVDRLDRDGADIIGMTGMPEAALAREIELDYAAIAVVANHAAGRGGSARGVSLQDIEAVLKDTLARVQRIIEEVIGTHDS